MLKVTCRSLSIPPEQLRRELEEVGELSDLEPGPRDLTHYGLTALITLKAALELSIGDKVQRPGGLSGVGSVVMKLNKLRATATMRSLLYNQINQLLGYSEAMPWHKGQSGNPGGLSKGSRRKLTDAFIRALANEWRAHGEEVDQPQRRRGICHDRHADKSEI